MSTLRLFIVIVLLASLDLAGTLALKEAALRRSPALALAGVALFVALAAVLYAALDLAELTIVSLGWIVLLQVAVCVVDALAYGYRPSAVQAVAVAVAVLALVVAAVAPSRPANGGHEVNEPSTPPVPQQRVVGRSDAGDAVPLPRNGSTPTPAPEENTP